MARQQRIILAAVAAVLVLIAVLAAAFAAAPDSADGADSSEQQKLELIIDSGAVPGDTTPEQLREQIQQFAASQGLSFEEALDGIVEELQGGGVEDQASQVG